MTHVVEVVSPSRVHCGLINESGIDGWVDGGVGISLDEPSWRIRLRSRPPTRRTDGPAQVAAQRVIATLSQAWRVPVCDIELVSNVPFHTGLGAKTSLYMGIARGYAHLNGIAASTLQLATLVGRGGTSGVGVHGSSVGGIVVDAGRGFPHPKSSFGPSSEVLDGPPGLRARYAAPADWRVLHLRLASTGLHGEEESRFFARECPVPIDETRTIIRLIDGRLLPALSVCGLADVNEVLDELQGLGLKRREWEVQNLRTRAFRDVWTEHRTSLRRLAPICLSSMGPTMYMVTDSPEREIRELVRLGIDGSSVGVSKISETGTWFSAERMECDD